MQDDIQPTQNQMEPNIGKTMTPPFNLESFELEFF